MQLLTAIRNYFDADQRHEGEAFTNAFAADAVVVDEGRTFVGHAAICAWWRAARSKFDYIVEPLSTESKGEVTTVRGRVSGQFPGSPVTLTYAFRLDHDRISHLGIVP